MSVETLAVLREALGRVACAPGCPSDYSVSCECGGVQLRARLAAAIERESKPVPPGLAQRLLTKAVLWYVTGWSLSREAAASDLAAQGFTPEACAALDSAAADRDAARARVADLEARLSERSRDFHAYAAGCWGDHRDTWETCPNESCSADRSALGLK